MFTVQYREEVRDAVLAKARTDKRIVSAAVVGSYARGEEDRWSDIDLTFGVDEAYTVDDLLHTWTEYVQQEFAAIVLFDVLRGSTTYRVFVLPGCLQLDLSFAPASYFGAMGPNFVLLYGTQHAKPLTKPTSQPDLFGMAVHHLLRARFCMERGKWWQAEFWISEARDYALAIACQSLGLEAAYARGYDKLPTDIRDIFKDAFVRDLSREELMRCLHIVAAGLPKVSQEARERSEALVMQLSELAE